MIKDFTVFFVYIIIISLNNIQIGNFKINILYFRFIICKIITIFYFKMLVIIVTFFLFTKL